MTTQIHYEMLGPNKVVLSLDDFEDLMDALAYDQAKQRAEETLPHSVVTRLLDGLETPIQIFREYRNLTQEDLAKRAGISQGMLSEIESRKKTGSVATIKAIAEALNVDLDDIA